MSEQAPIGRKGLDYHDIKQKTVTAVVVFVVLGTLGGLGTIAWNNISHGGIVRLLGGVTQSDLEQTLVRPGVDLGSYDTQNHGIPVGAVIAFEGKCPPGWSLANFSLGHGFSPDGTQQREVFAGDLQRFVSATKKQSSKPATAPDFIPDPLSYCKQNYSDYSQPIVDGYIARGRPPKN
jgi:hypothetical protein